MNDVDEFIPVSPELMDITIENEVEGPTQSQVLSENEVEGRTQSQVLSENVTDKSSPLRTKVTPPNVPSPFKNTLFWPSKDKDLKKRKAKEKIPTVYTSDLWLKYYENKEAKKQKLEDEKELKKAERQRKQAIKEAEKIIKKEKLEEKKKKKLSTKQKKNH